MEDRYKARVVAVFGSYVKGEEKQTVIGRSGGVSGGANLLDLVGISNYLEDELKIKVDVVPVDTIRQEIK